MSAKSKATRSKAPVHSVTRVHGNTRVTVTKQGHTTTTTRTVTHGNHRVTTTTVMRHGKVIRTSKVISTVTKRSSTSKAKRGAPGACLTDSHWVTGGNDVLETCVPVAAANSLLLATGYRVSDSQILVLAGPRTIAECLAQIGVAFRAAEGLSDGVIVGLPGEHAAVWLDGAAVSWGAQAAIDPATVEEAWEVFWR